MGQRNSTQQYNTQQDKKRQELFGALRTALMQLDDFQSLRANPLMRWIAPAGDADPVRLQELIMRGITALRDASGGTSRAYEILYYRYVEQLQQPEVAFQLGYSIRQLRREQNNAIEQLAMLLARDLASPVEADEERSFAHAAADEDDLQREIDWLSVAWSDELTAVQPEMQKALADAGRLAQHYDVRLACAPLDQACYAALPAVALRQAVLTLLSTLIPFATGGAVTIWVTELPGRMQISFAVVGNTAMPDPVVFDAGLKAAASVLRPFSGEAVREAGEASRVALIVPRRERIPILVIDDNPDARQLLQRYAAGSRFVLVVSDDVRQAVELAVSQKVHGAVFDIMMPVMDGWDLLAVWKHHPATQHIPVAVCSILPQQELSRFLGASLFIQKPVDRETFLAELETLVSLRGQAPE